VAAELFPSCSKNGMVPVPPAWPVEQMPIATSHGDVLEQLFGPTLQAAMLA
jgi:hypothetical protein